MFTASRVDRTVRFRPLRRPTTRHTELTNKVLATAHDTDSQSHVHGTQYHRSTVVRSVPAAQPLSPWASEPRRVYTVPSRTGVTYMSHPTAGHPRYFSHTQCARHIRSDRSRSGRDRARAAGPILHVGAPLVNVPYGRCHDYTRALCPILIPPDASSNWPLAMALDQACRSSIAGGGLGVFCFDLFCISMIPSTATTMACHACRPVLRARPSVLSACNAEVEERPSMRRGRHDDDHAHEARRILVRRLTPLRSSGLGRVGARPAGADGVGAVGRAAKEVWAGWAAAPGQEVDHVRLCADGW